jgi:hypothetical protein
VEIEFFAKDGPDGHLWDQFIQHVREAYPESVTRSVMLAEGVTDQARRSHPRVSPTIPIGAMGSATEMLVGDLSLGGMFLVTAEVFDVGSSLRVTLEDPRTRTRMRFDCAVRRRVSGARQGIGVEFVNLNEGHRAVLTELVRAAGNAGAVPVQCETVAAPRAPLNRKKTIPGLFAVRPVSATGSGAPPKATATCPPRTLSGVRVSPHAAGGTPSAFVVSQ